MTKRTMKTDEEHNVLLRAIVNKLQSEGMTVKADHISHPNGQPPIIGGHIPDIEARSYVNKIIVEAETADTVSIEETRRQFAAFSNAYGYQFHVIVPNGMIPIMQKQVQDWGLRVDKFWELSA